MADPAAAMETERCCATCVFWAPRRGDGEQSMGRCHSLHNETLVQGSVPMTRGYFRCAQWCGRPPGSASTH